MRDRCVNQARTAPSVGMVLFVAILASMLGASIAESQTLGVVAVTNQINRPVFVTSPSGDFQRLFIVNQRLADVGSIRVVRLDQGDALLAEPFLTVSPVGEGNDQGLLGLAFHPNYADNGYFYVYYTPPNTPEAVGPSIRLERYRRSDANPDRADPASGQVLLTIQRPRANTDATHCAGWMAFGPDGYLYISNGDGGIGDSTSVNAQDLNTLMGKILRIDVDGDDFPADPARNYAIPPTNPYAGDIPGEDEIWAYGLRNPWRCSFDRDTGDLWIGDVGQANREEVSFQAANNPAALPGDPGYQGGRNYGWRCMEGTRCTGNSGCSCADTTLVAPVFEYSHGALVPPLNLPAGCRVTGGYVYRGCAIPALRGQYFFADFCNREIYTVTTSPPGQNPQVVSRSVELDPPGAPTTAFLTSFGEDARGEMYFCIHSGGGRVYRIVETSPNFVDCNANGISDDCEILTGSALDSDHDGVLDECDCAADFDNDGFLTGLDFDVFVMAYEAGSETADFDGDGFVTGLDFDAYVLAFEQGC